ncbi:hypothetical protein ABE29_16080 [Cytobacillus firmus]|uniref:Exonuclease n=2 Tax=Cytobacillus firmus TaxID=1399 RepID=A0A800NA03_CYTFI|nr:hypothetical protein [Cytobacillus firmus]KAF0823238.1 exonuclease [Cytobacillus firmus]MBG9544249.1 hypothetical protein [Cytobacillus firmus]MBG9550586.1 hypothetical protein [Cytobacillus firmus]MBG9554372.1 hypothetical protein [Cytobacillus firmus]MBG9558606.1 hypothetical protein [Cytobacillus firmus]
MKDAWKLIKKTKKLVEKYENILLSRSGIFDEELISGVEELINFSLVFLRFSEIITILKTGR